MKRHTCSINNAVPRQHLARLGLLLGLFMLFSQTTAFGQNTGFTYQGRLTDGGTAANGNYDLQFQLFDSLSGGTQVGSTQTLNVVAVSAGIFTVTLDFGANSFPGASRFLDISARLTGAGAFTPLTPRQPITATPYAVRSLNAGAADGLSSACNGCITNANIGGVAASKLTGTIPVSAVPSGSTNYIQNATSQQASSNFNISGNGTAGGTLSGDVVNATTQYNIGANRVLSVAGTDNTFAGEYAGYGNTGGLNAFFGKSAGYQNTGNANSFFGRRAGLNNTTGGANSFFGDSAGVANMTGSHNTYLGDFAGASMSTGDYNTFIGKEADGTSGITNATAIGSLAKVEQSNSLVLGSIKGVNFASADTNVGIGTTKPAARLDVVGNINTSTQYNIGGNRVLSVTGTGTLTDSNTFAGVGAGAHSTPSADGAGNGNSNFGWESGFLNSTGSFNSFFGAAAGNGNTMGNANSFFGINAGLHNTTGSNNSFFGENVGWANKTGNSNTIIGDSADLASDNLSNATAIGAKALVSQSNSMVLGSIKGVGPGTADTKVGIGTDTPTATLTVVTPSLSSGENTATFKTTNNAQNQSHIHFGTTGNWFIRSAASAGKVILQDTGGNVGIGTSAPNAKLQVTGGNVYIANPNSLIITSSNGACWIIAVNNSGALSTTSVTCP